MKSALLIAGLLFCTTIFAQEENSGKITGQTSFYAELGGPGILFSANIDRRFTKSQLGIGGRIGIGFVSYEANNYNNGNYNYQMQSVVTFPIQINYIFGKPSSVHSFEVGAGATITGKPINIFDYNNSDSSSVFGTASFMYRRQPKDGGFSWRIGFTPIISNGYIQPSGGVSVGYNF